MGVLEDDVQKSPIPMNSTMHSESKYSRSTVTLCYINFLNITSLTKRTVVATTLFVSLLLSLAP